MRISLPQHQYFDMAGNPLVAGRLRIYLHDSTDPAPLYTLSGDTYSAAPNPVILDNSGEIGDTVWFDAAIVDVKVDASNGDGTYREISEFETGFTMPEAKDDLVVDGIAGLRVANPELGTVTVVGYDGNCYAPARHFVYDPECADAEDGGCIFESSLAGATGRWILVHADEKVPCTFYGVVPGHEANLASMMNIHGTAGQWNIQLPKIIRMVPGTYTSSTTYSTARDIYFDDGAKFTNASFVCHSVICPKNTDWLARDISCSGTAHSSWFRTVEDFWHCGAQTLCADPTNYFDDSTLRTAASLTGITVKGRGSLVTSYVNGAYFHVVRVCSVPAGFFTANDYVRLSAGFGDEVFSASGSWDPGLISAGHHQQYDQVPDLHSFASADRWLAVMIERRKRISAAMWNQTEIDLMGRKVSTFTMPSDGFADISNMVVNGTLTAQRSVTLHGVKATLVTAGSDIQVTAYDSELTFSASCQGITSVSLTDCDTTVAGTGFNPADTSVTVKGGTFSGGIALGDLNINTYTASHPVVFRDVRFGSALTWKVHFISMVNCTGPIKINCYPYADGGYYTWNIELLDNLFTGNARVWFGVFADADHPNGGLDGKCRMGHCRIVGNRFSGSDLFGIKRIHWNPVTLNCLIADGGTWEYHGNSGNCPRLNPGFVPNEDKWPTTQGDNHKWRIYDGSFNIWCPYLHYGDGSVAVAQEPTGLNPYMNSAVFAFLFTNDLSDDIGHYLYGYRTLYSVADIQDLTDEDINDSFRVKLAMGMYTSGVPTFDVGTTYFPGLDVV